MSELAEVRRFLVGEAAEYCQRGKAMVQPILAKGGDSTLDLGRFAETVADCAEVRDVIVVEAPEHWAKAAGGLGEEVDCILPMSIPAYPTEVWNSHPQPLVERGLPVIFWPLMKYDEPDFWRWSARDFLRALGVDVHIARNTAQGVTLLKSLAMKRFLSKSKIVTFGEQNFPWNAVAAGHLFRESLGLEIVVRPISDIRERYGQFSDKELAELWERRKGRYLEKGVRPGELQQAVRNYFAIKAILEEERACAFGLNCFGDLIIKGGRDVPCLAQTLLREDGYVAACDGDFCAIASMMLATYLLDKTSMMSNMYPVQYVGALTDHFGDALSPDATRYDKDIWKNLARLAHCGFVGVVSPEMTEAGKAALRDWGGTYEIKRDGSGCGIDADLASGQRITVIEMCFDARTLLLADAKVLETTHHKNMPHCETSALLEFRDLPRFVENISREHTAVVYGSHIDQLKTLADVLGLNTKIF